MDSNITKLILVQSCRDEAHNIADFLKTISQRDKELLLAFLQGAQLGKHLANINS